MSADIAALLLECGPLNNAPAMLGGALPSELKCGLARLKPSAANTGAPRSCPAYMEECFEGPACRAC